MENIILPFGIISSQAKDFINSLLKVRPSDRITAKDALEHAWVTSVDIDLTEFSYQWKINSRSRREIARREKREKRLTEKKPTHVEERTPLSASMDHTIAKRTKSHYMRSSEPSTSSTLEITRSLRSNTPSYSTIRESESEKPERKIDRIDRSDRNDRLDRLDKERAERAERLERIERSERTERLRSSIYGGLERSSTVTNSLRDRSLRASAIVQTRSSRDREPLTQSSSLASSNSRYDSKSDSSSRLSSSNLSTSGYYTRKYI